MTSNKPKRGKKKRRRRRRKDENDDQDENTNTSFSSTNSENSDKKVRRCMTDPKILDDKYPYKKIFIKGKKSGKFTKKGSKESLSCKAKGSVKTDQLNYAKKKRNFHPSERTDSSSELSKSELEFIKNEKLKDKEACLKAFKKSSTMTKLNNQYKRYKEQCERVLKIKMERKKIQEEQLKRKQLEELKLRIEQERKKRKAMEEEERRLMQQEDKRILDDNVKSINCEIAPNLISIDDLKDKSILAFKGNLNKQDIKLLRQRKFVIKDKPTPSERISASSSLKEFHKTNPAHSNQRNPYIKHLLKPSKNMIKRLIEENKRKRALEISQTMEKFKDIICDRERLTNIRIKKEIKNSTSANRAKKNDEMFIKRIQQSMQSSFDNREKRQTIPKNFAGYTLYPTARADSFERSVSRKARTQTMIRKANPKPKKIARLMSAKPPFPGRVSECKRLMNYKTLNTEKNLSDYDYANTAEQSLAKIKDFNYGSDYNSSIVETQRFSEVKPRVKSSYSKFRGFKI